MEDIASLLQRTAVIPVLTIERLEDAASLGRALVAGGLSVLEVTLHSEAAWIARRVRGGPPQCYSFKVRQLRFCQDGSDSKAA